ncbi:HypC/HybG/HupF family hydrogenase formation chaperone [bacterium]|nr:MAG: HypC/HybG/HupF family hydrogenase formation chaperone [bacterium]
MCVAVPGKIISIDESLMAMADFGGSMREISVALLPDPKVGDYVIVHAGFALNKVDAMEAEDTIKMMRQVIDDAKIF